MRIFLLKGRERDERKETMQGLGINEFLRVDILHIFLNIGDGVP